MKGIKQVKNYRLTKQIVKHSIWTVYESIDDSTNILYAIKTLQRSKDNKSASDCFKKEYRLLKTLNHENLVKIIGQEKTLNNLYLVMEYCNGGTLLNYLYYYIQKYKTPLPENKVQFIMRKLINGLDYMTKNKILHRDLNLDNILLHYNYPTILGNNPIDIYEKCSFFDSCLKISDLGYLKDEEIYKQNSTFCGIPYKSLSDNIQDEEFNCQINLFSLGAICYKLLTGMCPISNIKGICNEQILDNCINRIEISIEAICFINGLVQTDPIRRIEWKQLINHPFIKNDTTSFNKVYLERVFINNQEKKSNSQIWDMYHSHMISGRIDQIELISINEKENNGVKKETKQDQDYKIPKEADTIFIDNSKSGNNINTSFEYEEVINQPKDKMKIIERIESNEILDIERDSERVSNKIKTTKIEEDVKLINDKKTENEINTNYSDCNNKFSNCLINEYYDINPNLDERWEILYKDSKCVDIYNHENHYIIVQDYFN